MAFTPTTAPAAIPPAPSRSVDKLDAAASERPEASSQQDACFATLLAQCNTPPSPLTGQANSHPAESPREVTSNDALPHPDAWLNYFGLTLPGSPPVVPSSSPANTTELIDDTEPAARVANGIPPLSGKHRTHAMFSADDPTLIAANTIPPDADVSNFAHANTHGLRAGKMDWTGHAATDNHPRGPHSKAAFSAPLTASTSAIASKAASTDIEHTDQPALTSASTLPLSSAISLPSTAGLSITDVGLATLHSSAHLTTTNPAASPLPAESARMAPLPILHPGWDQALAGQVQYMISGQLRTARLQLSPVNLGPLDIRIDLASHGNDSTRILFTATQTETRQLLEQGLPMLQDMLRGEGLGALQCNVSDGTLPPPWQDNHQPAFSHSPHHTRQQLANPIDATAHSAQPLQPTRTTQGLPHLVDVFA